MDIQPTYRCAVGLDVHLKVIVACVIVQRDDHSEPEVHHRQFATFQNGRREMAQWIASFQPEVVAMESTGIYWKSPYAALERVGIRAMVVNAQHVKKVPGRKTDINDAQWLAMLARSGLLRPSFIPPEPIRSLRLLSRHHKGLTSELVAEKNRLLRTLNDAGIRLSAVVSDPHGQAASAMIDCLLGGGSPEQALALAGRLKAPKEQLLAALQGELSQTHRRVAQMQRQHIHYLQGQLHELEQDLFQGLRPYQGLMDLLLTIPGVDRLAAAQLIVEIGTDMSAFGSPQKLAMLAGICPGNHESAGKRRSGKTPKGNRFLRTLLCQIAWAAVRTTSQFKDKYQGLVIRRGAKRAIVAIGHKILKIVFVMLQRQVPYRDSTVDYRELAVRRKAPRWIRELRRYNLLPQA